MYFLNRFLKMVAHYPFMVRSTAPKAAFVKLLAKLATIHRSIELLPDLVGALAGVLYVNWI